MVTTEWNPFDDAEDSYNGLLLALWNELCDSRKHKAYYLFSILYSEAYWLEKNVSLVREAVLHDTLDLLKEKCDPADQYDDNIAIYFWEDEKGKFFIVLVYVPQNGEDLVESVLDIIPVKRNDYEMMQIYPVPVVPKIKNVNPRYEM